MSQQPTDSLVRAPFTFVSQPSPVPGDMRSIRRVALLLLMLRKCHGDSATFEQLHVLNWAIHSPRSQAQFAMVLQDKGRPDEVIVRFDPSLNRTIDLARGAGLVAWGSGKRLRLTVQGLAQSSAIGRMSEVLIREKTFLDSITGKISQSTVERLIGRWA
jgi:hypothetical protein